MIELHDVKIGFRVLESKLSESEDASTFING
jgi:hypothetical protein